MNTKTFDRIKARVTRDGNDCWIWQGGVTKDGYGTISVSGRTKYVHRIAYEHARGVVPTGFVIDHLCRVRHCANPDHLEAVSNAENVRRGMSIPAYVREGKCKRGHEMADSNLILAENGRPRCRKCRNDRQRDAARVKAATRRVGA